MTHDLQGQPGVRAALHPGVDETLALVRSLHGSGPHQRPRPRSRPSGVSRLGPTDRLLSGVERGGSEPARRRNARSKWSDTRRRRCARRSTICARRRGARRISIEAGPTTATAAYRRSAAGRRARCCPCSWARRCPTRSRGGELPPPSEIERLLGPARAAFTADEASGRWRFEHYRCAIVGGEASSR